LGIEPPIPDSFDIVLRDPTPVERAAQIPLPPPSVELALHDGTVESVSREIVLPEAISTYQLREPASSVATESTNILEHTFHEDITMSPAQPHSNSQAPDPNAQMANNLQRLRAEMETMRLAHENDNTELYRLWDVNQANEQALKRAELA
jgi:hypothetical protein